MVDGNGDQLVQVFLNLLKNAAEAVPEEEWTNNHHYQLSARRQTCRSRHDFKMQLPLLITVTDNGAGVPDELMDHRCLCNI